jgi:hypothetical protein
MKIRIQYKFQRVSYEFWNPAFVGKVFPKKLVLNFRMLHKAKKSSKIQMNVRPHIMWAVYICTALA